MSFVAVAIGGGALVSAGAGSLRLIERIKSAGRRGKQRAFRTEPSARPIAAVDQYRHGCELYPWRSLWHWTERTADERIRSIIRSSLIHQIISSPNSRAIRLCRITRMRTVLAGSGGALAAASQYNQGLATQQYGNYFNRLMQISQNGLERGAGWCWRSQCCCEHNGQYRRIASLWNRRGDQCGERRH